MERDIILNLNHRLFDTWLWPAGRSEPPVLLGAALTYQDAETAAGQFVATLGCGGSMADALHAGRVVIAAGGGTPAVARLARPNGRLLAWPAAVARHQRLRLLAVQARQRRAA